MRKVENYCSIYLLFRTINLCYVNGVYIISWDGTTWKYLWAYVDSEVPDQPAHWRKSDQDLHCLLSESLDATECMNGEQRPRWYLEHAQDDLNLCILCMLEDTFSFDLVQLMSDIGYAQLMEKAGFCHIYSQYSDTLTPYHTCPRIWTTPFDILLMHLNPCPAEPRIYPAFANSVDPDQLASEEANWSGSAQFIILYVNCYQQPGSSYLIGWKLEVGMAS